VSSEKYVGFCLRHLLSCGDADATAMHMHAFLFPYVLLFAKNISFFKGDPKKTTDKAGNLHKVWERLPEERDLPPLLLVI
jgi:hypothetical protein